MASARRVTSTFDLVSGALCLDFANTINSRLAPQHDYLIDYGDLLAWSERVGILSPDGVERLARLGAADQAEAIRVTGRARRLRESIYQLFSGLAAGEPPSERSSREIFRPFGSAMARATFAAEPDDRGKPRLSWAVEGTIGGVLDPIAYSAGELLLDADRPPVKECPGCGWLFLDKSRNASRRWCDMQTCGSRDKMRRYYRTRRTGPS